jgi:hypothetical protein
MDARETRHRIDELFARFNEPVIPEERITRWLGQFPARDRPAALALLESVTFHSYPRLIGECRHLHALVREQLLRDGFDPGAADSVDFTRAFTCKSGDIISYIYRKANAIPSVAFRTFD